MKYFATITLIGKDKSGVIAAVTQYLFQWKANIEGLEEQVLRGQFSMTLQASWVTGRFPQAAVHDGLKRLAAELRMDLKVHFARKGQRQRMALFVTRETHAPEAVLAAVRKGRIGAEVAVILSNRGDLKALARKHKIPFYLVDFKERNLAEGRTLEIMERERIDFIVLARFMKILSPNFVWRWKNKIINIHPSLLPAFPGASAYRQAYEKGVKVVGVTAHFATPDLDQGPIIWQEAFQVRSGETLASIVSRGQAAESKCLVKAVGLFLKKRLDVHWGRVFGV
ncbi:MAG: formyltetrahydrofolate deformylase [Verrucomicrobiales bacterium]|jgi:formyltetrahydrofolate deformylase|nr:formyltetrahydrofolate deformylase [Verrucomicrobiales bacterium]